MRCENLFTGIPQQLPEELVTLLCRNKGIRIERIVSEGQRSPEGFWYDQKRHEWVIVLEGRAAIEFEGKTELVEMERGSFLNIPAHTRHRVARTSPTEKTVWLVVLYAGE
jgi:cupin 2 domain-containing protein